MKSPYSLRNAALSLVPLIGAGVLAVAFCVPVHAQNNSQEKTMSISDGAAKLPVRAVTLFSSGVGYTLHEGEVDGDSMIPLSFRTAQINDILKSLVLLDEKGTVQPVVYGAKDPIGRTLQAFAVDVTQPLSQVELLNRLRGVPVRVQMNGGDTITGQIVSAERRTVTVKDGNTTTVDILTVLGDAGLQTVNLPDVKALKILDEKRDREFRDALTLLASGADDKKRTVTLKFSGQGKRRVRVGYVSEAPLWKISYRLLMGGTAGADEKPYLQGWALVENTSEDDWHDVKLSLISGRPVSFIQDLYQPLYLPRPVVPLDIVASPYPQVAEGSIDEDKPVLAAKADMSRRERAGGVPLASPAPAARGGAGFGGGGFGGGVGGSLSEPALDDARDAEAVFNSAVRGSVVAQAEGSKAGELFQYNITTPVTLPRQQAAMIPVLAQDIEGEKVSLYNADIDPKFPLNAFRIRNNTRLHLKGGPVTLFDGNIYAGDARMEDIPPGDNRLVTYAVDLAVEGERKNQRNQTTETTYSLQRGVLNIKRQEKQTTEYSIKNKDDKPRKVLIEHPYASDYKLVEPAAFDERTRDRYRFAVTAAPGKTEKLTVVTTRPVVNAVALINYDASSFELYITSSEVPAKIKEQLRDVQTRRKKIQELQAQAAATDTEIQQINQDQDRIRKNMNALDKASTLYKRYVTELDQQETRIQSLRAEGVRLRAQAATAESELRTFLDTLTVTN